MQLSLLDTQMRMEVDLSKVRSAEIPEGGGEMFKAMGMDRVITISRLDQKTSLIIFPGLQATLDTPMTEEEADSLDGEAKVVNTELGQETIDGHPCTKNKFVITDKKGRKQEGTVWNATDLKNFPVQLQIPEKDNQVTIKFSDIKFQKPDARLFVLPTGYKQYGSMAELMGALMLRAITGGGK
jgi:transcriptional regulator of met regulon